MDLFLLFGLAKVIKFGIKHSKKISWLIVHHDLVLFVKEGWNSVSSWIIRIGQVKKFPQVGLSAVGVRAASFHLSLSFHKLPSFFCEKPMHHCDADAAFKPLYKKKEEE